MKWIADMETLEGFAKSFVGVALLVVCATVAGCHRTPLGVALSPTPDGSAAQLDTPNPSRADADVPKDVAPDLRPDLRPDLAPDGGPASVVFASVTLGSFFACGLKTDSTIACLGDDSYYQSTPPEGTFASVSASAYSACGVRGDATIACWGDNYYGAATPPAGTFVSVSVGYGFACGLRTDHTLACWGNNVSGEADPPAP